MKTSIWGTQIIVKGDPVEGSDLFMVNEGEVYVEGRVSGKVHLKAGSQVSTKDGILNRPEKFSNKVWLSRLRKIKKSQEDIVERKSSPDMN